MKRLACSLGRVSKRTFFGSMLVLLTPASAAVAQRSAISTEVFRLDCRSDASTSDVTLFANGTLRLREGLRDRRNLLLLELDPVEREALIARLEELDLRAADTFGGKLEGEWVGHCLVNLSLPSREPAEVSFHRLDTLSLELQRAVNLGDELAQRVRERAAYDGLPKAYRPQIGDYLRRPDGEVFEVMGFTSDERAVEMAGVDQPIVIYIPVGDLSAEFVELLSEFP